MRVHPIGAGQRQRELVVIGAPSRQRWLRESRHPVLPERRGEAVPVDQRRQLDLTFQAYAKLTGRREQAGCPVGLSEAIDLGRLAVDLDRAIDDAQDGRFGLLGIRSVKVREPQHRGAAGGGCERCRSQEAATRQCHDPCSIIGFASLTAWTRSARARNCRGRRKPGPCTSQRRCFRPGRGRSSAK